MFRWQGAATAYQLKRAPLSECNSKGTTISEAVWNKLQGLNKPTLK